MLRGQFSAATVFNTPRSVATYKIIQGEGGVRYAVAPTFSVDGGVRYGYQNFENAIRFNQITQATFFAGFTWVPLPARF
jgi:hypothetical protein